MGWIPFHLTSSLLLVLTNLQPFYLPSTYTILCLSKLPLTSDTNNKQGNLGMHVHMRYISWYSVILVCIITGNHSCGADLPSTSDYTKYCIIIACTVTIQLPVCALHGVCYSYTSGGDDQSPNVVYYGWAIVWPRLTFFGHSICIIYTLLYVKVVQNTKYNHA